VIQRSGFPEAGGTKTVYNIGDLLFPMDATFQVSGHAVDVPALPPVPTYNYRAVNQNHKLRKF
jgi:hypothetical protein